MVAFSFIGVITFLFFTSSADFNCNICADALQASPSFPQTPRGQNIAHHYLDEGHPFSYDPTTFDIGSSVNLSEQLYMNGPNGMQRKVQATIETDVTSEIETSANRDFRHTYDSGAHTEEIEKVPEFVPPEPHRRTTLRRRSKLAPRLLSASILPTRRKKRTTQAVKSSDLLTFDEEKDIAEDIRRFRSVTRARDNLSEWMSREINRVAGGNQHGEPSEYQLASSCSLSVDQLHEVMARGQEARTRLIKGNVGLVTMIAKRYHSMLNGGIGPSSGGGAGGTDATLKLDDLIQEGYMGIMEAAERFDPTKGFRFSTYATHWIRQRILRAIAESSRMIRLPVYVQTMIRNMHKKNKELELEIGRRPSMPELAHEMGVPLDKIHLYQHLTKNVLSLELPVDRHSNTEDKRTLGDRVACTEMATPDEDFMSQALRGEVHNMLDALGHNERLVLTHRFGLDDGRPKSLRETAEGMGVSRDVVRTVEAKALNQLRQPRMNYRLKDYVGGQEAFAVEPDYGEPHHGGMHHGGVHHGGMHHGGMHHGGIHHGEMHHGGMHHGMMTNNVEEQQNRLHHYPHHMNVASSNTNDNVRADDLDEYERPTPESIWSF
eukprot:CAMPEP_0201684624 /NCGR_PEP_ID=MMETSP0494-20130426/52739_1 /ASSEMBLY_ACC=CAM_ASM_000839 /TAXON_ID=420259 /ORGANISM="Thalassiosira gravida, Strain GMp14c1" /LENGTH=603 /DNA_ID=CAMNT_0048168439 /DNA_START=448 /DNA_END=2260 /DNA_ORIENTATION=-